MEKTSEAFDDFVDDCFLDEDPLCDLSRKESVETVTSQLIVEMMAEDGEPKTCLVSLMDEPKVA